MKLTIEVDTETGVPVTKVSVDGEPIGVLQSLEFSANSHELVPKLKVAFPDMDLGWAHAEKMHKLGFAEVVLMPLGGE